MNFRNLDDQTRRFMLEELEYDLARGKLYLSPRLSETGKHEYAHILRSALQNGSPELFAAELRRRQCLKTSEERRTPKGGVTQARVPAVAAETLAEGEFNRFYIRGVCRRAIDNRIDEVTVYRAKEVRDPRPESQAMIGRTLNAQALLGDLRANPGVEPALGLPPGPNSGLSVMIP